MYELIISQVVLEEYDGVTYPTTRVFRFEFDREADIEAVLREARTCAIAGGQMSNAKEVK
jgi:hypothetical protein